jgi:hypothetical protein
MVVLKVSSSGWVAELLPLRNLDFMRRPRVARAMLGLDIACRYIIDVVEQRWGGLARGRALVRSVRLVRIALGGDC